MANSNKRYIFSPLLDFILLGGGSLILLPLLMFLWPLEHIRHQRVYSIFIAISVFFTYAVNFPHFMYSYQIFYEDFLKRLKGEIDKPLQPLYIWTSIVLPLVLANLLFFCYLKHDFMIFGFLGNVGLLVNGWHYAKQGFGVLIVTSVYQQVFFKPWERRVLLWNANILWAYLWIMINTGLHHQEFWHVNVYTLGFPREVQNLFFCLACAGGVGSVYVLIRKYIRDSVFPPLSGIVGYGTSLYFWLVFLDITSTIHFHPVVLLIPSMHAIQYITIVFKMKHNELDLNRITPLALAAFMAIGLGLGFLSFEAVPRLLDKTFTPHHDHLYEEFLIVIIFAVFINIHHYFIDNVIWRKENSKVNKYLYGIH